ncbi:MAG: hypothetical protein HKN74_02605 [Acidimicrobiia bacterium]|nr:hypothetical protein [Acidimicrobiia bacterium]NNF09154.1 hypothetical protein [Acidimicrobiia bacterium]
MAEGDPRTVEDVFNQNLTDLLDAKGMSHRDLLEELEAAGYTPDTPATVLLNDAVAMAAVLGVSPLQLLMPKDLDGVDVTPAIPAETRVLGLWLRGLRPLLEEDFAEFFRRAPLEDLDAALVAENWVWSERVRTTSLIVALNDAVDAEDLDRVKVLTELARRQLDQPALEEADRRIPRFAPQGELQAAVSRATRFRRQAMPKK